MNYFILKSVYPWMCSSKLSKSLHEVSEWVCTYLKYAWWSTNNLRLSKGQNKCHDIPAYSHWVVGPREML